jgi:hypothetical protein
VGPDVLQLQLWVPAGTVGSSALKDEAAFLAYLKPPEQSEWVVYAKRRCNIFCVLRVFIRLAAATTVPGSSKRVLTRFTDGLLRAPTDDRPLDSLDIYFHLLEPVKRPHFHPSWWARVSAPWGSHVHLQPELI